MPCKFSGGNKKTDTPWSPCSFKTMCYFFSDLETIFLHEIKYHEEIHVILKKKCKDFLMCSNSPGLKKKNSFYEIIYFVMGCEHEGQRWTCWK